MKGTAIMSVERQGGAARPYRVVYEARRIKYTQHQQPEILQTDDELSEFLKMLYTAEPGNGVTAVVRTSSS